MADETHDVRTVDGAFLAENSWASTASATVDAMQTLPHDDPSLPVMAKSAEIYATLAVAFEQRMTRFDLSNMLGGSLDVNVREG